MRRRGLETTQEHLGRRPEQERALLENQPIVYYHTAFIHPTAILYFTAIDLC